MTFGSSSFFAFFGCISATSPWGDSRRGPRLPPTKAGLAMIKPGGTLAYSVPLELPRVPMWRSADGQSVDMALRLSLSTG